MEEGLPDRIGQYEILRRLAYGGMAEVLLARLRGADQFSKHVVIKRVLPQHCANHEFVSMFRDEARITSQLHHGNIAQVLEFGESGGSYWLALEYVDGPSLGATLSALGKRAEGLSIPEVAHITAEVARALDYAHRKRDEDGAPLLVVHRDVSPANVLLSREGEVKLADFGIALARARLNPTVQAGVVKGKLSYMAPELFEGGDADPRSDLFALGAVVYEMLTGRRAFGGSSEAEIVHGLLSGKLPPPSTDNPDTPPELDEIVMRLLRKNPDERPGRGLEVADAVAPLGRTEGFDGPDRVAQTIARVFPTGDTGERGEVPTPSYIPRRRRVLMVDESRTMRALVRSMLRARYRIVEADSVSEALRVMRDEPPHAVISQRNLRGTSAFELFRAMASDEELRQIPFVLLASDPTPKLQSEARDLGIAAVVPKSLEGLQQKLREAMERGR